MDKPAVGIRATYQNLILMDTACHTTSGHSLSKFQTSIQLRNKQNSKKKYFRRANMFDMKSEIQNDINSSV